MTAPEGEQHTGQLRMAYRLAHAYNNRLLHVHGIGWHYWTGTRWAEDERGEAQRAVYDVLRQALAESLDDKDLRKDVQKCESASGTNGVLDLAAAMQEFAATVEDLDRDGYLLNCANGTLDLRTMEMKPHDPQDRITKVTRAAYDPEQTGETWEQFLESSLPNKEVRDFLKRYVGVGLLGTVREHILAILTGTGRNGKGVFYGAVGDALGDYATTAEPDLFMHRDGGHPTGEMDLRGARWVVVSESDKGRRLAEATVKRLTGGDRIKARRMRRDFVEFDPSHTAALITNHLPKVSGDDPALWARLRVVPFDVVFSKDGEPRQDPDLTTKLQLEIDAVLTWAIQGWQEYQEKGLAEPDAVSEATSEYQTESDAVARFILERCITGPAFSARSGQLFDAYKEWCTFDGADPMSQKAFGQALDRAGYPAARTMNARLRQGIGLIDEPDEHDA